MKLLDKSQILIEVFCLIIIISLCAAVYFHGKSLSCDKCSITFKQIREQGRDLFPIRIFEFKIIDLYSNLTNGRCLIEWDDSNGFKDNSNKIILFPLQK